MREQVYTDPRPKEYFDRFHERARTREPDWVYEVTRVITSLYAYTFLRARGISTEKVPGSGAVILAPNHFSFMDHFLMGCYIRRKVRFMAKSQLFKPPMQFIYSHGGVFPVRRGARDEETFITAETILAKGGAITMYCEGGRSRTGKVAEQAKRGIGRLALETGRAGRADRDLRLLARAQLEAAAVPQGHRPVRGCAALGADREPHARAAAGGGRRGPARRYAGCMRVLRSTAARGSSGACARSASSSAAPAARRRPEASSRQLEASYRAYGWLAVTASEAGGSTWPFVERRRSSAVFNIYVDQASVLMPAAAVVFVFTRDPQHGADRRRARARRCVAVLVALVASRCSRAWSSSWSPTSRTAAATPPSGSCSAPSRRCSAG